VKTNRRGGGDVKMMAETGVMWPQAKKHLELPEVTEAGRTLEPLEQHSPVTSWFQTSDFQSYEELIPVALGY
jgi:hypothetical protein